MDDRLFDLVLGVLMIVILLPLHESAHAFVANRLGDPTARLQKRLSLNPLRHIDPVGAILLLTVHFGWGRPVPVDPRYFRNPKRDMALVAVAGPLSNVLIAFVLIAAAEVVRIALLAANLFVDGSIAVWIWVVLQNLALVSIYLALFNLLPVPPLDGSRLLEYIIPGGYYKRVAPYQKIIYGVLLLLLFTGVLSRPISAAALWIFDSISGLFRFAFSTGYLLLAGIWQ